MENWTGQNFGVRLVETVPGENKETGLIEFDKETIARAEAGAARAKVWWAAHKGEFAAIHLEVPAGALAAMEAVPAGDFSASAAEGKRVRLSDFRGKVVLINFWTTWCTACVEMPELIALQKRHQEGLVVLGMSLDGTADDDDKNGAGERTTPAELRQKVARVAKARGLSYTILLDDRDNAGGRFNGGELPTSVIVDEAGNVRGAGLSVRARCRFLRR